MGYHKRKPIPSTGWSKATTDPMLMTESPRIQAIKANEVATNPASASEQSKLVDLSLSNSHDEEVPEGSNDSDEGNIFDVLAGLPEEVDDIEKAILHPAPGKVQQATGPTQEVQPSSDAADGNHAEVSAASSISRQMSISLPNEDIAQAPNPGQASTTNLQKEQTVPRNVDTHPAASKPSMEAVYMDRVRKMRRPARQLFGGLGAYEARTMALDPLTPFAKSAQPAIPMATSEELLSELPGYDATLLPAQAQQETASSGASQAHTRVNDGLEAYLFSQLLLCEVRAAKRGARSLAQEIGNVTKGHTLFRFFDSNEAVAERSSLGTSDNIAALEPVSTNDHPTAAPTPVATCGGRAEPKATSSKGQVEEVMVKGLDEDAALHGSKAPVSPAHPPFDNRGTPGVKTVGSQMSVGVVVQGEASAVEDTTELELPTRLRDVDSSPPELMASTLSPLTVQPNAAATPPNGSPAPQAAQLIHSNQPTTPTSNISSIASVPNHPLEQQELQPVQSAPVMVDSPVAATSAELAAEPVGKATTAVQPPHPTMQNSAPGRTVNTLVSEPSGQLSSALQGLQSYPPVQPQQSAAAVPQHLPQGLAAVPALMQQSGHDPDKASHAVHSGHSRLHPTVASELRSPGLAAVPEVVQQLAENQVPHAVQPRQPASVVSEHLPKGLAAVPAMVAEDQNQMPHAVHAEQISFQTMPATEALVQQAVSLGEADAADFSIVDAALGREEVTTSAGNVHTNIRVLDEDDEEVGAMDESDDEAGANVFEGITVLDGDDNEVGAMEDYDDEADSDLFEDEVPILGGRRTFASSAQ